MAEAVMPATNPNARRRTAPKQTSASGASPVTPSSAPITAEADMRLSLIEADHDNLRNALFGADRYRPGGILGDMSRSLVKVQNALDDMPTTMLDAIKAERASRGTHKFAAWQLAGIVFGIVVGVIVAGAAVYSTLIGLSHSVIGH